MPSLPPNSNSESMAEFIANVQRMRDLQRKFFATRSSAVLQEAKEVEAAVDQWLRSVSPATRTTQRRMPL